MKVILLENVRKIGSIGEIIDVKRGFARNYLISKKKALFASKENIKEVEKIKQELDKLNVKNQLVVLKNQSSIIKHRIISQNQHILRIDFDNGYTLNPLDTIYKFVKSKINSYDVVILSDYAKGTLFNVEKLIKHN